jgi:hypothetical protein
MHQPAADALAGACPILGCGALCPFHDAMIFVEALAVARRPLRIVRKCSAVEEREEVRQELGRKGANLD